MLPEQRRLSTLPCGNGRFCNWSPKAKPPRKSRTGWPSPSTRFRFIAETSGKKLDYTVPRDSPGMQLREVLLAADDYRRKQVHLPVATKSRNTCERPARSSSRRARLAPFGDSRILVIQGAEVIIVLPVRRIPYHATETNA